jgi:hypothetical protein
LDVRAQGALSTDLAFRVRNSADSANIATIQGDGSTAFGTYTNPNTKLTVTGTTFGAYISGNTGIYAQSNTTSGTLYAIDCLGRALSGANTSYGIKAASDTSGVGSTNYGGRFHAYNGTTNYAGYFDSTGGTNNYAIYVQRGDMVLGVSPTLNKIGFWNATPIVQPTASVAIDTLLTNTGLRATGGNANFDTPITSSIILNGTSSAQSLNTTAVVTTTLGSNTIYSIPAASYDGAWFEYTVRSGSNARAGQIMSIWSGSSVNFTETTTTDFGTTAGIAFTVMVSGSNLILTGSSATAGWTVKTIVRSI